jgi:hypothetical protein
MANVNVTNAAWTQIGSGPASVAVSGAGAAYVTRSVNAPTAMPPIAGRVFAGGPPLFLAQAGTHWATGATSATTTLVITPGMPAYVSPVVKASFVAFDILTFAALPAASSANAGYEAVISDSTTTTNGAAAAGGGTNNVKVRSNGVAWTVLG